jgi:hypothetical protein
VTLGNAANGWIAGHLGNQVQVHGDDRRLEAHSRGRHRCLTTGMSSAYYGYIELFSKTHRFSILRTFCFSRLVCSLYQGLVM